MVQSKRVVGITGGSGCGKSYISTLLREQGVPVIDCDVVAREVMGPGTPCLCEAVEFFGTEILSEGRLDRQKLAQIVFSDENMLKKLNEITHKYILKDIYNKIEQEKSKLVCVDGAVLIESGIKCDKMIGILADRSIRKLRIQERDGLSEEAAENRINAQKPDSFYLENCDRVFYNNGHDTDFEAILKGIIE